MASPILHRDVLWKSIFLLSLTAPGTGLHVSVSPLKTRMKAGSNVLLSCMFDTGESVIDLKHLTVTWTLQGGHTVAEFQYGEISTWKGVRLFKDGLSNGNASILIRKLTKADTGDYKCEVEYSAESAHQQMNLQIYEKELQVNVTPSKVQAIKGNNAVLNCTFTIDGPQFELEFLALRWLLGEKEVIRFSNVEIPNRTGAKLSNVMKGDASLLLPDIKTEDEGNYTCYVQYTPETAIQMLHLKVTGSGLHVSVSPLKTRVRVGSNVLLSCMFDTGESHIDLTQLTVTWIFEGGHIVADFNQGEIAHWHGMKLFKDGLHNGNASLLIHSVTKDDEGYYRCQVKYSSESAFQQMNVHIQDPEADSTEIPVLRTTSMTEQEGNQVTQVIPVTDVYEVESMTAVKMSSVTQSKEVVLKSTDTAKETQPMALLKREHSIILGCLVVIVIIAASVLIYFCSRKRQKDKTAESDADL